MRATVSLLVTAYLLSAVSPALAQTPEAPSSYDQAIDYVTGRGMMSVQADGKFHPERMLSRLDLIRSIVRDVYAEDVHEDCFDAIAPRVPARYTKLFTDLALTDSNAREVCVGMFVGLVEGKPTGAFSGDSGTNLVEAAKIVSKAYGIAPWPALKPQPGVPWHEPYWYALAKRGAIPESVLSRNSTITRGEFAEILYRLQEDRPAYGFKYRTVHVKDTAETAAAATASTESSYRHPLTVSPSIALAAASPAPSEPAKLSSGLAIQMHVEERRTARLERMQTAARSETGRT